MNEALSRLIDAARNFQMTESEREEQRISFAYGSAKIENDLVTEEMVREAASRASLSEGSTDG